MVEFEVGTGLKPSEIDEDPAHLEMMKSISEVEVLKKSLQSFKEQNKYLNDSNEKLMIANKRLREDLKEIDANYQELITVSKEVLRRNRATQQQYEELINKQKQRTSRLNSVHGNKEFLTL